MTAAVLSFALRESSSLTLSADDASGLESIIDFVHAADGTARVSPLDSSGRTIGRATHWHLVAPDPGSLDATTQAIHFLHLPADAPVARLRDALLGDPRVARVDDIRPELDLSIGADFGEFAAIATAPGLAHDWAITKCGFPTAWTTLEQGADPGGIAVIDKGRPNAAAPKDPAGLGFHDLPTGASSNADHAAAVAGIVAPHSGTTTAFGCCSAHIELYNVYAADGTVDKPAIAAALLDASKRNIVAVNMSFTLLDIPHPLEVAIQACVSKGILLVASVGETASPNAVFPAKHPSVLAITGTTPIDAVSLNALTGDYIFLAAPGQQVESVGGFWSGTSFAAPMVSAAIWLARHKRPDLSPSQIRDVLGNSGVNPNNLSRSEIGGGRLDMPTLVNLLAQHP